MHIRILTILATIVCVGCTHASMTAHTDMPAGAECFYAPRSIVYPLGDRDSTLPSGTKVGAWLVLSPAEPHPKRGISGEARTIDLYKNQQAGFWWPHGDSVRILVNDLFTSNQLELHRTHTGLEGRGVGTTDVLERDSSGVSRPVGDTWTAELQHADCGTVPQFSFPWPTPLKG